MQSARKTALGTKRFTFTQSRNEVMRALSDYNSDLMRKHTAACKLNFSVVSFNAFKLLVFSNAVSKKYV